MENRQALLELPAHPQDWLILAGDVGETLKHLEFALKALAGKFAQLLWVPGNHDLWTIRPDEPRGEAKYARLVEICRQHGVLTPEDPFATWTGPGGPCVVAPLFTLYDYSFGPPGVDPIAWAAETNILCADERYLYPDPYPNRADWCAQRCQVTEARLGAVGAPLMLVGHWPLRQELAVLPRIPRFVVWCGTRRTHDWHTRFGARVVVSGHVHIRSTRAVDGVRFEEVSLGYPHQWERARGLESYLREVLPGPDER